MRETVLGRWLVRAGFGLGLGATLAGNRRAGAFLHRGKFRPVASGEVSLGEFFDNLVDQWLSQRIIDFESSLREAGVNGSGT